MHFLYINVLVSIKNFLKFVPKDPISNIPALVPIMAWRWPGAYMRHSAQTQICQNLMSSFICLVDKFFCNSFFRRAKHLKHYIYNYICSYIYTYDIRVITLVMGEPNFMRFPFQWNLGRNVCTARCPCFLTHCDWDKMAVIFQTASSNALS